MIENFKNKQLIILFKIILKTYFLIKAFNFVFKVLQNKLILVKGKYKNNSTDINNMNKF